MKVIPKKSRKRLGEHCQNVYPKDPYISYQNVCKMLSYPFQKGNVSLGPEHLTNILKYFQFPPINGKKLTRSAETSLTARIRGVQSPPTTFSRSLSNPSSISGPQVCACSIQTRA